MGLGSGLGSGFGSSGLCPESPDVFARKSYSLIHNLTKECKSSGLAVAAGFALCTIGFPLHVNVRTSSQSNVVYPFPYKSTILYALKSCSLSRNKICFCW